MAGKLKNSRYIMKRCCNDMQYDTRRKKVSTRVLASVENFNECHNTYHYNVVAYNILSTNTLYYT